MINLFSKKIVFTALILACVGFFPSHEVSAQPTSGNCQVTDAKFRLNKDLGVGFYDETPITDRPYVYVDLTTQNCSGEAVQVSIIESGTPNEDVDGSLGAADPCDNSHNDCMRKRSITMTQSQLSLVLQAGEDGCDQIGGSPHCDYFLKTWDESGSTAGHVWPEHLQYNCFNECTTSWYYIGILDEFEASYADDPDSPEEGGGGIEDEGSEEGGGGILDEDSGPTVIDLDIKNPLAGSVDTIPELFHKIVDIIIKIGIPLVAMAIVYSGLLFVTARGKDEQLKQAKNAFAFAIIGGLILLASWLVADAVKDALTTINT